jgi:hypothetical protein
MVMKCPNCGAANPEGKLFCGDCGISLPRLMTEASPSTVGIGPSFQSPRIRKGYVIGGGLIAAVFFGLFYWAIAYTWTEQVWQDLGYGIGYWLPVTRTVDPAIQAIFLVVAIIGSIAMIFGLASRK